MQLCHLSLDNFRNYDKEKLHCHKQTNIICGDNAQGKSNLLEAISFLSIASSFRGAANQDLIGWGKKYFFLEGQFADTNGDTVIAVGYNENKKQRWQINGTTRSRRDEIIGFFHTVLFSPEDLDIVKSGPVLRRRYLNRQMVQLYPDFCFQILRYNHILKQRNSFLKNYYGDDSQSLEIWNEQLITTGSDIIWRRQVLLQLLIPFVVEIHRELSGGEELSLRYRSLGAENEWADIEMIRKAFRNKLASLAAAEKARGITLAGPHRDDIVINIGDVQARAFGSQGQQRSVALSLKLAELELGKKERGEYPVLLLDDVMSELDLKRRQVLLKMMIGKTQTFITATDVNFDLDSMSGKYVIKQGKIISGKSSATDKM